MYNLQHFVSKLLLSALIMITLQSYAQDDLRILGEATNQSLKTKLDNLVNGEYTIEGDQGLPCTDYLTEMAKAAVLENINLVEITDVLNTLKGYIDDLSELQPHTTRTGSPMSYEQRVMHELVNSTTKSSFIENLTGIYPLDIDDESKKAVDRLYEVFNDLKPKLSNYDLTDGQKIIEALNCKLYFTYYLSVDYWDYTSVRWSVYIPGSVQCECDELTSDKIVESSEFEITAQLNSSFTDQNIDEIIFDELNEGKFKILSLSCCKSQEEEEEEDESVTSLPNDGKPGLTSLPTQTIGGGIGLGYGSLEKEIAFCLQAEYLRSIVNLAPSVMLFGGVSLVNEIIRRKFSANSNEINNSLIVLPTLMVFTQLLPWLYFTAGLEGGLGVGLDKFSGVRDLALVSRFAMLAGVVLMINDAMFGFQMSPFAVDRRKYKNGFAEQNVGFNLNKTAFKIFMRFALGK